MTSVLLIYPYFNPPNNRSIFRFPPLGVAYVAASLRNAGYDATILDCTFLDREDAVRKARALGADVVGIYSMVTMHKDSIRFAKYLRDSSDLLIAGGPLPSCDPVSFLDDFDIVVKGEGEHAMPEILRAYEGDHDFSSIPGIVYRRSAGEPDEPVFTRNRELETDLDEIAFPARDLLPNNSYIEHWKRRFGYATTTIITIRGCPFSCEFCSNAVFDISYRERSPESVVDEVEHALSFGYDKIHFADDVFTRRRERVLRVCEEIRRGLNFRWECLWEGSIRSIRILWLL